MNLPTVIIYEGTKFVITFESGKVVTLTWEEWMAFRKVQNSLIYTEPV